MAETWTEYMQKLRAEVDQPPRQFRCLFCGRLAGVVRIWPTQPEPEHTSDERQVWLEAMSRHAVRYDTDAWLLLVVRPSDDLGDGPRDAEPTELWLAREQRLVMTADFKTCCLEIVKWHHRQCDQLEED